MSQKITPEQRRYWAEKLGGLNEQYLYQCLTGRRDMKPGEARRIERDSEGVITRQMLCQKTWREIWPELVDQAALAEQPAPAQNAPAHSPSGAAGPVGAADLQGESNLVDRRRINNPPPPDLERRAPEAARLAGQGV